MKYKLVNSIAMKGKCERLGLDFSLLCGWDILDPFMYIDGNRMGTGESRTFYLQSNYEEITQKDFLALPEPLKVGDWVKFYNSVFTHIFKINAIEGDCARSWHEEQLYDLSKCTKLSHEQIEILELT